MTVGVLILNERMMGVARIKSTKLIGLIAAVGVLVAIPFIPTSEALSGAGVASICILLSVLVLLLTDALPIAITCLLGPSLLILFKATAPGQAYSGFTNPIIFFVIASFGTSLAISSTNLSKRLLVLLMKWFGNSVEAVILAIMICSALLSAIMSNVAATVIFISVALDFLNIYDNEADKKQSGKAFMISLPVASMVGGMMTPAGSSLNLMVLSFLEELTGLTVPFVKWMFIAIPIVIVVIPIAWKIIVKINKPAKLTKEQLDAFVERTRVNEKLSRKEKIVVVLLTAMITCWVLSSWFPIFNVTVVAVVGISLMFLPGVDILNWEDFSNEVSWSAILLLGSVISLGNALIATGASQWFVNVLLPSQVNLPQFVLTFIVSIMIFVLLIVVPVAPALISILSSSLILLAGMAGLSPILLMMTLALTVANCYLLPFDTVPLITYMTGYYTKGDLAKTAVWIQLTLSVCIALWVPVALGILQL